MLLEGMPALRYPLSLCLSTLCHATALGVVVNAQKELHKDAIGGTGSDLLRRVYILNSILTLQHHACVGSSSVCCLGSIAQACISTQCPADAIYL